jgi:hypothetical protein
MNEVTGGIEAPKCMTHGRPMSSYLELTILLSSASTDWWKERNRGSPSESESQYVKLIE